MCGEKVFSLQQKKGFMYTINIVIFIAIYISHDETYLNRL